KRTFSTSRPPAVHAILMPPHVCCCLDAAAIIPPCETPPEKIFSRCDNITTRNRYVTIEGVRIPGHRIQQLSREMRSPALESPRLSQGDFMTRHPFSTNHRNADFVPHRSSRRAGRVLR